jgi:hypothetical protein
MIFGIFTLCVGISISLIAEYYSIIGLISIFPSSPISIAIMGATLALGKITAAIWLKLNWHRASFLYKLYLIPAIVFLMFLTAMGSYGFLSKSHLNQSIPSSNVSSQIALLDEKISIEKENIDVARKALQQLDKTIDETIARSTSEEAVIRAANLRRSQQAERRRLQGDITNAQNNISGYTAERQPLVTQLSTIEAKVGPIKYIAALIYGDNVDNNLLERAVRIVIIIIVAVFDPLALILIIAAQQSLRWARAEQQTPVTKPTVISPQQKEPTESEVKPEYTLEEKSVVEQPVEKVFDPVKFPYLNKFDHFKDIKPVVWVEEKIPSTESAVNTVEVTKSLPEIPETAERYKAPLPVVPETLNVRKIKSTAVEDIKVKTDFGNSFPANASKGDTFLRVDYNPNKLYKYNGVKWIEIDKSRSDSYSYDEKYIDFLIEKISSGEYDIEQLSSLEQDLIAEKLKRNNEHT